MYSATIISLLALFTPPSPIQIQTTSTTHNALFNLTPAEVGMF